MSHLLLTHQMDELRPEINPRVRRRAMVRLNFGPVTVAIVTMVLIGLLGLLSLTYLNAQSTKGYMINKLEDEHQTLVSDSEINDMLILQARSIKNIEGHPRVQAMHRPERVVYLDSVTAFAQASDRKL